MQGCKASVETSQKELNLGVGGYKVTHNTCVTSATASVQCITFVTQGAGFEVIGPFRVEATGFRCFGLRFRPQMSTQVVVIRLHTQWEYKYQSIHVTIYSLTLEESFSMPLLLCWPFGGMVAGARQSS
jgi:hypothetical protein